MTKWASPFYELDKIFAILGSCVSILLIFFGAILGGKIMFLIVGFLILIPCLLWLVIRKDNLQLIHFTTSRSGVKIWAIVFFVLFTLDILTIYLRPNIYERPILFFVITALMAGAVACECITAERRLSGFILIQIILLGVILGGSQTLIFPGLNGFDDWYHADIIKSIVDEHYIPLGLAYSSFPVLHILCAINSLITTLSIKLADVVTVDFGQIIGSTVFVFFISNNLFKNHQIGLLSAFFIIIADVNIRFSYLTYPNAFSMVFAIIILYIIFNKVKETSRFRFYILLMVLFVTLILTHMMTAIFMAILLFSFWIALFVYGKINKKSTYNIPLLVPITFATTLLLWWTYASMATKTFAEFISVQFATEALTPQVLHPGNLSVFNIVDIIFTTFPYYLSVSLALFGIFYMISRKGSASTYAYSLLSIIPVGISFIFYIFGGTPIFDRWFYFAQVLLSIPLALGIFSIGTRMVNRSVYQYVIFFVLIILLSSIMITCELGNHDNRSFPPSSKVNIYHTQSELAGYDFFVKDTVGILSIDIYSFPVVQYFYHVNEYQTLNPDLISGNFRHDGSIKILRHSMIHYYKSLGTLSTNIRPGMSTYLANLGFNKIYQNDGLEGYS